MSKASKYYVYGLRKSKYKIVYLVLEEDVPAPKKYESISALFDTEKQAKDFVDRMKTQVILKGFLEPNGVDQLGKKSYIIKVWCPYCHTWHIHGWDIMEKKPSPRAPHCPKNLWENDYFIMPYSMKELKEIQADARKK